MEIISVNIQKGGSGKTTSVQAIAEILNRDYGKKILCIDLDPQCNLTTVSGIDIMQYQDNNMYTLLKETSTLQECIVQTKYYDIIPGSILLSYAETEFNRTGKEYFLKERLSDADYDYILIDTPPALGLLNVMSLTASTKVIIPTECSYLSMIGLNQLYELIGTVRKYSNKELQIAGVLLIKYSPRLKLNVEVASGLEQMAARMDIKIFNSKIRETVKIKEAQSQQIPLLDWDSSNSAVSDYISFVKELEK
jgi:chromosome partitioning protein